MHGVVKPAKSDVSRKSSAAVYIVGGVAGIVLYKLHVAQKWDAAFVGTLALIWGLAAVFRSRWNRISFWVPFVGCSVVHIGLIWFIFARVIRNIETVGILAWIPVTMIEGLGLYYLIDLLDRKFSNDRVI